MKTVLFDFDGTLTQKDSLRPLAAYLASSYTGHSFYLFLFNCSIILYKLRVISDKRMKEAFLSFFLKGKTVSEVEPIVNRFFRENLTSLLNINVYEDLQSFLENGDKVFLVSANFDFFLQPLVGIWGIAGVICTETEKINNIFSGKIHNSTCKGRDKVKKVLSIFSRQDLAEMTAYGNADDKELLGLAGKSVLL